MLRKAAFMNGTSNGTDGWAYTEPKKRWTPPWRRQHSTLQYVIIVVALSSASALIYLAHGGPQHQHRIQLPYPSIDVRGYQHHAAPSSLEFPLWWHAPFVALSGKGEKQADMTALSILACCSTSSLTSSYSCLLSSALISIGYDGRCRHPYNQGADTLCVLRD